MYSINLLENSFSWRWLLQATQPTGIGEDNSVRHHFEVGKRRLRMFPDGGCVCNSVDKDPKIRFCFGRFLFRGFDNVSGRLFRDVGFLWQNVPVLYPAVTFMHLFVAFPLPFLAYMYILHSIVNLFSPVPYLYLSFPVLYLALSFHY